MKRLLGGLLLASGILVMTCSGLCSLWIIIAGADEVPKGPSMLLLPLIFGGIPFLCGLAVFFTGRTMLRQERERLGKTREDVRTPFE